MSALHVIVRAGDVYGGQQLLKNNLMAEKDGDVASATSARSSIRLCWLRAGATGRVIIARRRHSMDVVQVPLTCSAEAQGGITDHALRAAGW